MRIKENLIDESLNWLNSFDFIGCMFPSSKRNSHYTRNNNKEVTMCNIKDGTYKIENLSFEELLSYDKNMLVVQFGSQPSKVVDIEGITIISERMLLALAFYESMNGDYFYDVMNKELHVDYKTVFENGSISSFCNFISYRENLYSCMNFIKNTLEMIVEDGITYDLMLECKVNSIYQDIFHRGFLFDIELMKNELNMIQNEVKVLVNYFKDKYLVHPDSIELKKEISNRDMKVLNLYKKLKKINSTFSLKKLTSNNKVKNKPYIACSYNQIGTRTMRISTKNINVLGLPKRLRQHLIPQPENVFVEADFHASQLVIIAGLANERWLLDAYENEEDIYIKLASYFFQRDTKLIQENERKAIKKIFFAFINGAGIKHINEILIGCNIYITMEELKTSMEWLKISIPNVIKLQKALKYKQNVTTLSGRRWNSHTIPVHWKRLSHIIQIIESEILLNAIIQIDEELKNHVGMRIYITKHDSITLEVVKENINASIEVLKLKMEEAVRIFFDISKIQINITVTPQIIEMENMNMKNKKSYLNEVNMMTLKNLRAQVKGKKNSAIKIVKPVAEEEYPALITDVNADDNIIRVDFKAFINQETFAHTARFNMSTKASYYYDRIVETLGDDDGNIIGKLCLVVFHENSNFLNIEVIEELTEEQLGIDMEKQENDVQDKVTRKLSNEDKLRRVSILEDEEDEEDEVEYDDEYEDGEEDEE